MIDYNVDRQINYYRLSQYDFNGFYEIFDPISIDNRVLERRVVKYLNILGQEIDYEKINSEGVYIEVYDDRTTKKIIK